MAADARTRPWPWMTLLVGAVTLAGLLYVSRLVTFFVQTDEMTYFKASFDIWQGKSLLTPGEAYFSTWGQLAPLLRAPAFALGRSTEAFDAAHMINVLAFASSAIPVYLLARPVLRWSPLAVLAAALSVAIPWLAITGTMLAEPMAYPAFCWALLGMQRSLASPGARSDLLAFAGIALAFFGRTQFAILAPALLLAVVAHEVGWPLARPEGRPHGRALVDSLRAAARRHVLLLGLLAAGVLVLVVVGKDRILGDTLGSYTQTAYGDIVPRGTGGVALDLLAVVGIGCGVLPLPLALAWVARTLARPGDRDAHAFACLALAVGLVMSVVVGSYVVRYTAGPGMADRYFFYLAPILFIGMLACVSTVRRAPAAFAFGALAAFWVYHGKVLFEAPGSALAPAGPFHVAINQHLNGLPLGMQPSTALAILAVLATAAIAAPRHLIAPRTLAVAIGSAVLAFCGYETFYTLRSVATPQEGTSASYQDTRDWVDQALPAGARAGAVLGEVYDGATTPRAWWEAIFFNDKVRLPYYDLADNTEAWGQTSVQSLSVDERTGAIKGLGGLRYVVRSTDDRRWPIIGARTVRRVGNFELQAIPAVKRAPWTLRAGDQAGRIAPGGTAVLRLFGANPARARLVVNGPPPGAKPITLRLHDAAGRRAITLAPGATSRAIVVRPLRGAGSQAAAVRMRAVGVHGQPALQIMSVQTVR